MPTASFYPSADGPARYYNGAGTWSSIRGQSSGTDAYPTANPSSVVYSDAALPLILRGFWAFDTSSLPDNAVISAATLKLYGSAVATGSADSVHIVQGSQGSPVAVGDYSAVGSTSFGSIALSSWSNGAYNSIALDASGIAAISLSGTTKFAARASSDLNNSAPGSQQSCAAYYSEESGTSKDPVLEVTYTLASTTSDSWAWSDSAVRGPGPRTTADSWAWSDSAAKQATPAARSATGAAVTVFTGGTIGTSSAHYAFPSTVFLPNGKLMMAVRKAESHNTFDGWIVAKLSSDDGQTWGSEFTILAGSSPSNDYRPGKLLILDSGRLIYVAARRTSASKFYAEWSYSDDPNGAAGTWSTPATITNGFHADYSYADDLVELANGDLLCSMYGKDSSGGTWYIRFSKSTDGGATWSALSSIASIGGYNVVESQMALLSNGDIFCTFHTEDGLPTDWYRTRSQDSGATWTTPVKVGNGDTFNRQSLAALDQTLLVGMGGWGGGDPQVAYRESYNGVDFGSMVTVATYPVGGVGFGHPLWSMPTALGGSGTTQNVGIAYDTENTAQTQANVYYKQFAGLDGTIVYRRATADSWAWSDTNTQSIVRGCTTSDAWAWGDSAARSVLEPRSTSDTWDWGDVAVRAQLTRGTSDAWAWGGAASSVVGRPRTSGDTWGWLDAVTGSATDAPGALILHPQGMVPGTAISAYRRWEWKGPVAAKLNAGPGASVQDATVASDLTVTFNLPPGEYVAYASAYPTRRLFFMVTE